MVVSTKNFDLEQIANSGQCFRWEELAEGGYHISTIKGSIIAMSNGEDVLISSTSYSDDELREYFDLYTDYQAIIDAIPQDDEYLKKAAEQFSGIRILKQNLWETMVSFMISQNNNISRIKKSIEKLCDVYGTFPSLLDIASFPSRLETCGLGYREKYLYQMADYIDIETTINRRDVIKEIEITKSLDLLKDFNGIGDKVANCILLFGCHDLSCCPIDTWMKKIIKERYNGIKPDWMNGKYAGVYQQYVFCYERLVKE